MPSVNYFKVRRSTRAKSSIKALLDIRPLSGDVFRDNKFQSVKPQTVEIGETIQIKAGEKVPLDGEMMSDGSSFNTAALTGESKPNTIHKANGACGHAQSRQSSRTESKTKKYGDSSLARILDMVQNATARKATTRACLFAAWQKYIRQLYFLAVALVIIPFFVVPDYVFRDWLSCIDFPGDQLSMRISDLYSLGYFWRYRRSQ